jgi:hypothetical protein
MIKKLAWVFAIVLTLVGILGFVPGITSEGNLLGIFEVDTLHNIIHLVSGLVFLFAVRKSTEAAKTVFKVFGIVYGLVAVVGLIQGDSVLGLITVNAADHVLHVVIAIVALWLGFKKEAVPMVTNQQAM